MCVVVGDEGGKMGCEILLQGIALVPRAERGVSSPGISYTLCSPRWRA